MHEKLLKQNGVIIYADEKNTLALNPQSKKKESLFS